MPHEATTVDLTRVEQPGQVSDCIAEALGHSSFASLLADSEVGTELVVLDNCEHVLSAAADATAAVLAAQSKLLVLATSRSPLDLEGESIVALGPLQLHGEDGLGDASELFVQCATDRGVDVSQLDLDQVAAICRQVDGVPLALEIAAARLSVSTPSELLDSLSPTTGALLSRPRFRGRRDDRSVTEVVTSSLGLLPSVVVDTFDQISVLAGPFRRESADAVATAGSVGDHLAELTNASLLSVDLTGKTPQYRLLHPVRAVALARLREAGRWNETMERLVDHTVQSALSTVATANEAWDGDPLEDLRRRYLQIATALRWSLEHDEAGDRGLALVAVLWGVVHQGHVAEIVELAEHAVERWPDPAAPWYADAVATMATGVLLSGDPVRAHDLAAGALNHAAGSPFAPVTLHRCLGHSAQAVGRFVPALESFRTAADHARSEGMAGFILELDTHVGLLVARDDTERGTKLLEAVLAQAIQDGSALNTAYARGALAAAELTRSPESALATARTALQDSRRHGFPAATRQALYCIAVAQLLRHDDRGALETTRALLDEAIRGDASASLRSVLELTAALSRRRGGDLWQRFSKTAARFPLSMTAMVIDVGLIGDPDQRVAPFEADDTIKELRSELDRLSVANKQAERTAARDSPTQSATLQRRGDVWLIEYGGGSTQLRHSKGLKDLAKLLSSPGREFAAMDLMDASVTGSTNLAALDQQARRNYEARIIDLQSEVAEAEAHNDIARAARLQEEMDQLVDQLAEAIGLGGRDRQVGTETERARSAVTHRIRSTIARIEEHMPRLAAHLRTSVTTGTFCRYEPDGLVEWNVS